MGKCYCLHWYDQNGLLSLAYLNCTCSLMGPLDGLLYDGTMLERRGGDLFIPYTLVL